MLLLRLIVACVLAVSLPLQGLAAAAMLGCDDGQVGRTLPNSIHAPAHAEAHASHTRAAQAAPVSTEPAQAAEMHSRCAACASACCHAVALPAPLVLAPQRLPVPAEPLPAPLHYASWTESVPHKPPRP